MEGFDKKDIDEEVPAYMKVGGGGSGEFQFCCVCGETRGDFLSGTDSVAFDFTWGGNDECDEAFGDGWIRTEDGKTGTGQIRFHCGDKYGFSARRVGR